MRAYSIRITGGDNDIVITNLNSDGTVNPGGLDIELDIPVYNFAAPTSYAHIKIWGLPLTTPINNPPGQVLGPSDITISQATDLNGREVEVYAGMAKGLPLANPQQYGLLLKGMVFQAFGNWVDTEMTLEMYVCTDGSTTETANNIVFDWRKGTPLSDALKTTLKTAYPNLADPDIKINPSLVWPEDFAGHYQTPTQFAQHINKASLSIISANYLGLNMTLVGNQIRVYDGSTADTPIQIQFTEMIGQPTWMEQYTVQVNLMMRYDLAVGTFLKFPPAPQVATQAELTQQAADKSAFQGIFIVSAARHVGRLRASAANSWVTVVNATSYPPHNNTDQVPTIPDITSQVPDWPTPPPTTNTPSPHKFRRG